MFMVGLFTRRIVTSDSPLHLCRRDVDLSYDTDNVNQGKVSIHFDEAEKDKLGCICLEGELAAHGISHLDPFSCTLCATCT